MAVHGLLSVVLAFVLTGFSTVVVALRFYTRHVLVGKLGPSDWVMLLALIAAWASVAVNWYLIHFLDFGRATSRESIVEMVTMSLLFIWIYRLSYIFNLCLIKTSILLYYKRIASMRKSFHHIVGGLIAVILIGSASMIVAAVLTCYPVDDAWRFDVFERGTKGVRATQCYNPGPFWVANAGYNLATDILIWSLPILFFLNLTSMSWRRRLEFIAIFSVGIMAIVASAARLRTIIIWLSGPKQQQENAGNLMIWSQVEQNTGIIAGSIPLLRPLFRRMLGRARRLDHPNRGPAVLLNGDDTPEQAVMPRALIIPSPTPTIDEREFSMPKKALAPIELRPQCAWGNTIWDGTQVRQVLT